MGLLPYTADKETVGLALFLSLGAGRGKDLCIGEVLPRTDHKLAAATCDYSRARVTHSHPDAGAALYLYQRGQPDAEWGRPPVSFPAARMTL